MFTRTAGPSLILWVVKKLGKGGEVIRGNRWHREKYRHSWVTNRGRMFTLVARRWNTVHGRILDFSLYSLYFPISHWSFRVSDRPYFSVCLSKAVITSVNCYFLKYRFSFCVELSFRECLGQRVRTPISTPSETLTSFRLRRLRVLYLERYRRIVNKSRTSC